MYSKYVVIAIIFVGIIWLTVQMVGGWIVMEPFVGLLVPFENIFYLHNIINMVIWCFSYRLWWHSDNWSVSLVSLSFYSRMVGADIRLPLSFAVVMEQPKPHTSQGSVIECSYPVSQDTGRYGNCKIHKKYWVGY